MEESLTEVYRLVAVGVIARPLEAEEQNRHCLEANECEKPLRGRENLCELSHIEALVAVDNHLLSKRREVYSTIAE